MPLRRPFAAVLILLAACQGAVEPIDGTRGEGVACTGNIVPGIEVEVVDARSGAYVARGAGGTVRDGAFVGVMGPARGRGVPPADTLISLQGAYERTGTYTVTIERDGYQPWQRAGVVVTRNVCHVNTELLVARLVPTS